MGKVLFTLKNEKDNLLIFIHGFIGGKETWLRNDNKSSILNFLQNDKAITDHYDIAVFSYYSKFTDYLTKMKSYLFLAFGRDSKFEKNNSIEDIAQLLESELQYKCATYKNIVLIAHSMGGLVAKSYLLKTVANEKSPIKLFISLAVPHRGSDWATLGKVFLKSPQIKDLKPLEKLINEMNDEWIKVPDKLPKTIYFQAKNDQLVSNLAAIGPEEKSRKVEIIYTDDDHFSIVRPATKEDVVITAIKKLCLDEIHNFSQMLGAFENKATDYFLQDKDLFEKHLLAFDRPAFKTPCVYELFLRELSEAIDNTQAAINTGKLYDREGNLLDNYLGARHFKTEEFREAFNKIGRELTKLKFHVTEFETDFKGRSGRNDYANFYSMFRDIVDRGNSDKIKNIIKSMDKIDSQRNEILNLLNELNPRSKFGLVELSSSILRKGQMSGNQVKKYLP